MPSIIANFAGLYSAVQYAYGWEGGPANLAISTVYGGGGNSVTGVGSITLTSPSASAANQKILSPLNTNAPIAVGAGTSYEIVTPTAVSNATPGQPLGSTTVTANFANVHGTGEPVASGTFGLQEAINAAAAAGGGTVIIDGAWALLGGTNAMVAAATFPAGVGLLDNRTGGAGGFSNYTITVANPQVLTNNTVPTPVLPAPPATAMWDVLDLVVENKNAGVAYTGGGAMALYYGTSSAGVLASATIATTFMTVPTVPHVIEVKGALADTVSSNILGKGIVFTNPTADWTAGTGTLILKAAVRLLTGL